MDVLLIERNQQKTESGKRGSREHSSCPVPTTPMLLQTQLSRYPMQRLGERTSFSCLPPGGEGTDSKGTEVTRRNVHGVRNLLVTQAETQTEVVGRAARGSKACQQRGLSYQATTEKQTLAHWEAPADIR